MTRTTGRRIVLASRPKGRPSAENFRFEETAFGEPGEGEVLLETLYLSLDPYMRGRMSDAPSYAPPVQIGETMVGGTVSRVLASRDPNLGEGDFVLSYSGWQTHEIAKARGLRKLDPEAAPLSTALGVLGMPGFTAYVGLGEIGKPKEGETVVVAAASGPVGSAVGQIAKLRRARSVGIAGGADKCAYLTNELGFDAAVDHRADDFKEALKAACPNGIDVYFENVGGPVQRAVWPLLNPFARVPVCGLVAHYNDSAAPDGPDRLPGAFGDILRKSLTVRGFIQHEFVARTRDFAREASAWVREGKLRYREDMVDGLDAAPQAFFGMLEGKNFGKLVVRVKPE